ncbi:hypothetical protein [Pseudoneobacillus sp. C159]
MVNYLKWLEYSKGGKFIYCDAEDDCCDGLVFLVAKKMFNQKYLVELVIRKRKKEMPYPFYSCVA